MSSRTNVHDELQRTKRELKRLRSALPQLMRPEELLDLIVTKCRDVMLYSSILDRLHHDVPIFSSSNERWSELERDAQILGLKTENCEVRFLSLRHSLRTLYTTAPLLIATGKTSAAAWESMMEQQQRYYDEEGRQHDLPTSQNTMKKIIADQLHSVRELYGTLRSVRSTILSEERTSHEANLEKMTASLDGVQKSIQKLIKKVENQPQHHPPHKPREAEVN